MPVDTRGRYEVMQWLMFQMAGIGPMQGQAVAFIRYFPEEVPQAINRYSNETRRLYEVLNQQLTDKEYLADRYSIADIANYSWLRSHLWARVSVDGLDHLQPWMALMGSKPGIQKGCNVPPLQRSNLHRRKCTRCALSLNPKAPRFNRPGSMPATQAYGF
jgi:GST-like protein